ncbi:MAG: hypothetical protein ACREHD_07500, partial [Pirellulales bacterium]
RHLFFEIDRLTPPVAETLGRLRNLRMLSIKQTGDLQRDSDTRLSHDCLLAVGRMSGLEDLSLEHMVMGSESFKCLAGLTNLKSLQLHSIYPDLDDQTIDTSPPMLGQLPPLPGLETLIFTLSWVGDRDLQHLAVLPRLKTLSLWGTKVTDAGLRELAAIDSLEELAIDDKMATVAGLQSLLVVERLNILHIDGKSSWYTSQPLATLDVDRGDEILVPARELDGYHRAVRALRSSNAGIVIDRGAMSLGYISQYELPWTYENRANHRSSSWPPIKDMPWLSPPLRGQIETDAAREGVTTSF